jgi:VTC domain-containing protein
MPYWTEVRESRAFAAEIKFLVPLEKAEAVRWWARSRLSADPFGGGPQGDTYCTTSLYFDTAGFDVLHRRGSFGRSKYRIRRYGQADQAFLERKLKKQDLVSKRRSLVGLRELGRLDEAEPAGGWPGYWFHRRVLARGLGLVCRISYRRTALVSANQHGSVRLTLDEDVRAACAGGLHFGPAGSPQGLPLLPGHAILECKYHVEVPPVFTELAEEFSLAPVTVSKYRLAGHALGFAVPEGVCHAQAV